MTKVLHILDIAGIPSILSHYYNKLGKGKSELFYHEKNSISSSISRFYEGVPFEKFRNLLFVALIKSFHYDIIHIHGAETLIPLFKVSGKKIVLHYHGSDINEQKRSFDKKRIFARSMADLIIYNGKNMENKIITSKKVQKEYLPNPIDTEHFSPDNENRRGALSFVSNNLDKEKTINAIRKISESTIIDLDIQQIPYSIVPKFLSKYEMYIDIKIMPWGQILEDLSTTALQALSCGCKVYHNNRVIETLPSEHKPENVIKRLDSFYNDLLK
jgi:hypothetical protein